jgi:hypothetical protein
MRWLKRKSEPPAATAGQATADKALDKATQELRTVNAETSEILETVGKLRRLGEQNDFAARLREAMGGP